MGDLFVHAQMKDCCRATLVKLDGHKKATKRAPGLMGVKSLHTWLGGYPIDIATTHIVGINTPQGDEIGALASPSAALERTARATCKRICESHYRAHINESENEEATFWRELTQRF